MSQEVQLISKPKWRRQIFYIIIRVNTRKMILAGEFVCQTKLHVIAGSFRVMLFIDLRCPSDLRKQSGCFMINLLSSGQSADLFISDIILDLQTLFYNMTSQHNMVDHVHDVIFLKKFISLQVQSPSHVHRADTTGLPPGNLGLSARGPHVLDLRYIHLP